MKRLAYLPILLSICTLMLSGCEQSDGAVTNARASQPMSVDVLTLVAQKVTLTRTLPARTVAYRKAEVRPQVTGIIEKRLFTEGTDVKAGQQLYQIDPAVYDAQLANAEAELAKAKATLQTAKAKESRYKK